MKRSDDGGRVHRVMKLFKYNGCVVLCPRWIDMMFERYGEDAELWRSMSSYVVECRGVNILPPHVWMYRHWLSRVR